MMKIAMLLSALALSLMPTLASADGCRKGHQEAAMSCAEGLTWNPMTKACEASTS
jgi:hypothetical protein